MKSKSCFVKNFAFIFLAIVFSSVSAIKAQNNSTSVRGKVTSENGNGLAGVTVSVKGTSLSTLTNDDGSYQINVPTGKKFITFSHVGYEDQTVAVERRSVINLAMDLSEKELENVVVIGYGTQKKKDVTGAVSTVSSKEIEKSTSIICTHRHLLRPDKGLIREGRASEDFRNRNDCQGSSAKVSVRRGSH